MAVTFNATIYQSDFNKLAASAGREYMGRIAMDWSQFAFSPMWQKSYYYQVVPGTRPAGVAPPQELWQWIGYKPPSTPSPAPAPAVTITTPTPSPTIAPTQAPSVATVTPTIQETQALQNFVQSISPTPSPQHQSFSQLTSGIPGLLDVEDKSYYGVITVTEKKPLAGQSVKTETIPVLFSQDRHYALDLRYITHDKKYDELWSTNYSVYQQKDWRDANSWEPYFGGSSPGIHDAVERTKSLFGKSFDPAGSRVTFDTTPGGGSQRDIQRSGKDPWMSVQTTPDVNTYGMSKSEANTARAIAAGAISSSMPKQTVVEPVSKREQDIMQKSVLYQLTGEMPTSTPIYFNTKVEKTQSGTTFTTTYTKEVKPIDIGGGLAIAGIIPVDQLKNAGNKQTIEEFISKNQAYKPSQIEDAVKKYPLEKADTPVSFITKPLYDIGESARKWYEGTTKGAIEQITAFKDERKQWSTGGVAASVGLGAIDIGSGFVQLPSLPRQIEVASVGLSKHKDAIPFLLGAAGATLYSTAKEDPVRFTTTVVGSYLLTKKAGEYAGAGIERVQVARAISKLPVEERPVAKATYDLFKITSKNKLQPKSTSIAEITDLTKVTTLKETGVTVKSFFQEPQIIRGITPETYPKLSATVSYLKEKSPVTTRLIEESPVVRGVLSDINKLFKRDVSEHSIFGRSVEIKQMPEEWVNVRGYTGDVDVLVNQPEATAKALASRMGKGFEVSSSNKALIEPRGGGQHVVDIHAFPSDYPIGKALAVDTEYANPIINPTPKVKSDLLFERVGGKNPLVQEKLYIQSGRKAAATLGEWYEAGITEKSVLYKPKQAVISAYESVFSKESSPFSSAALKKYNLHPEQSPFLQGLKSDMKAVEMKLFKEFEFGPQEHRIKDPYDLIRYSSYLAEEQGAKFKASPKYWKMKSASETIAKYFGREDIAAEYVEGSKWAKMFQEWEWGKPGKKTPTTYDVEPRLIVTDFSKIASVSAIPSMSSIASVNVARGVSRVSSQPSRSIKTASLQSVSKSIGSIGSFNITIPSNVSILSKSNIGTDFMSSLVSPTIRSIPNIYNSRQYKQSKSPSYQSYFGGSYGSPSKSSGSRSGSPSTSPSHSPSRSPSTSPSHSPSRSPSPSRSRSPSRSTSYASYSYTPSKSYSSITTIPSRSMSYSAIYGKSRMSDSSGMKARKYIGIYKFREVAPVFSASDVLYGKKPRGGKKK